MLIPEILQRDVLIFAFRYALGRSTYAPHTVIEVLRDCWDDLELGDQELFAGEITSAITCNHAGMDMDKSAWAKLLRDKGVK